MNNPNDVKTGTILLAEPFSWDSNFKRSVVFLTEHNEEGTIGFVLNKQIDMNINQLMAGFPEFEADVWFGGPVATDTVHYIHSVGHLLDDSVPVVDGIWWGGDFQKLKALIRAEMILPRDICFFVGYSGWSKGQLAEELESGSWITAEVDKNYIFKDEKEELWQQVMEHKGNTFSVIGQMGDDVVWN